MSMKCTLGIHDYDNCKCKNCGHIRHEHHVFTSDCEKCSVCGTVIENQHHWSEDCEKCSKCGKTRAMRHSWKDNCEECSVCGKTRHEHHKLVHGTCTVCGKGTYTDKRDGKIYTVVKIGNQVLMGENFALLPDEGNFWSFNNEAKNAVKYGYLYDWDTAVKLAPVGWHLPSKKELETLYNYLGGQDKAVYKHLKHGGDSGFDGLLSGWRIVRGAFNGLAASGHFWSCTEDSEKEAWQFKISGVSGHADIEKGDKGLGLSVRYFRD